MSRFNKETQKSVRVVLPLAMYNKLKKRCRQHGDMSDIVRRLLREWLKKPESEEERDVDWASRQGGEE